MMSMEDLLRRISRCSNIDTCIDGNNEDHPCSRIILSQGASKLADFYAPEPWSGRIETAPILFIGDNTRMIADEEYPTLAWPDYLIKDFFNDRFGGGRKKWIKDGLYPLCSDGTHKKQWNRLWSACANRTHELFESFSINPGHDFAVSETVRCRTFKQLNISKAVHECCSQYLKQVIEISGALIVVGMGPNAKHYIHQAYDINTEKLTCGPIHLGGRERYFAFLPHYNRRGPRSFGESFNRDELNLLVNHLKNTK